MERLKQVLAFPLYATVAWLIWVLGAQLDNDAVVRMLVTLRHRRLRAVVVAALSRRHWRGAGEPPQPSRILSGGRCRVALAARRRHAMRDPPSRPTPLDRGMPSRRRAVADLREGGRPVFVDFTAAWCVTCQVNKRLVLNDAQIRDAFASHGVELVRADWTRRDPVITRALAALGRQGVPVYVSVPSGQGTAGASRSS